MGHVLQGVGRVAEAETRFRSFVDAAPDSITCTYADATWLLGSWSWIKVRMSWGPPAVREEQWSNQPCEARMAASDTIWWLSDPLYVVEGNDRWSEHIDRNLKARSLSEIQDATAAAPWTGSFLGAMWAIHTRRGPPDSHEWEMRLPWNGAGLVWTSKTAARYHFVPDFEGEGLSQPTWRLEAEFDDEGYTPPYAPFYALPLQVARFRMADDAEDNGAAKNMRIATAGSVLGTPIEGAAESGYLVLSDAPESFPLQLSGAFNEGRAVYLAQAPAKRYVTSFEVLTDAGIGWHREMLEPLDLDGPGLSDILLYEPVGYSEPDSLLAATSMMLGTTELEDGTELGLYWEVYGAEVDAPLEFELQVESEQGGFIERLRRLLPGGTEEGNLTLSWTEPAIGPVSPRAIVLDLGTMETGSYTVVIRARWEGQSALETRRTWVLR
jgi:hypothetical protein